MRKNQYIYVLRLVPRLLTEENWTDRDEEIVDRHFRNLQKLLKDGKLILAGKTDGLDQKTFGIVIFEAASKDEAIEMMNHDPCVAEGIMVAELYPYTVALMKNQ